MKEYFSHDYNARNDTKLVKVFMKYGLSGIGAFWCIVEMLFEESGYLLRSEYDRIAFELRTDNETIKSIVEDYELFQLDDERFWSESGLERLKERMTKSQKARESVQKRWEKYERNTNVKQSKNERYTSKVKESKGKETKEDTLFPEFWLKYHDITGLPKTDRGPAEKYFLKLSKKNQNLAIENIEPYFNSLPNYSTGKPVKKARTYLSDENFLDEFNSVSSWEQYDWNDYKELTMDKKEALEKFILSVERTKRNQRQESHLWNMNHYRQHNQWPIY